MTKPGPRPLPTNMRLLHGLAPSRTAVVNEAKPTRPDMPEAPPWISAYALEEWERLAQELYDMGVLTLIDQTMLAAYCMAYARWRQAEEDLAVMAGLDQHTHGVLLKTKEGNAIQNPLVGIANTARRDMLRLALEFGLTPSSRTLIAGGRGEEDPREARYFKGA